jgi:hypothetical protein
MAANCLYRAYERMQHTVALRVASLQLSSLDPMYGSYVWLPNSDQVSYAACQLRLNVSYWFQQCKLTLTATDQSRR